MKQKKFKKTPWYKDRGMRNTIILSIFIVFLMGTSALSMYTSDDNDPYKEKYNGHNFIFNGNYWLNHENNIEIITNPSELKNISINKLNINSLNYVDKIYYTFEPDDQLNRAIAEFAREIQFSARGVRSCPEDNEFCSDLPLKTCKDSDTSTGIIYLKISEDYNANFENNCLIIEGPSPVKAVNKFILEMKL